MMANNRTGILGCWLVAGIALIAASAAAEGPASSSIWDMTRQDQRDWIIKVSGGASYADLDGWFDVDHAFGTTRVRDEDLNLDNDWNGWVEVDLQLFKKHHLRATAIPMKFKGKRELDAVLNIGPIALPINETLETVLRTDTYELAYMYDFYLGDWVTLSPLLHLAGVHGKFDIEAKDSNNDWKESQWLPVFAVGMRAEFHLLPRLQVFGEGKGITIGKKATYWDAQAGLEIWPLKWVSIIGTYRWIDYDVDWDNLVLNARMEGPFIGASIRW